MGKISIRIKEKQPLPCKHCNGFYGYQYYDRYKMHYTSVHTEEGVYDGGEYTDGVLMNKGKTAYCANCGEKLPFSLKRELQESVEGDL